MGYVLSAKTSAPGSSMLLGEYSVLSDYTCHRPNSKSDYSQNQDVQSQDVQNQDFQSQDVQSRSYNDLFSKDQTPTQFSPPKTPEQIQHREEEVTCSAVISQCQALEQSCAGHQASGTFPSGTFSSGNLSSGTSSSSAPSGQLISQELPAEEENLEELGFDHRPSGAICGAINSFIDLSLQMRLSNKLCDDTSSNKRGLGRGVLATDPVRITVDGPLGRHSASITLAAAASLSSYRYVEEVFRSYLRDASSRSAAPIGCGALRMQLPLAACFAGAHLYFKSEGHFAMNLGLGSSAAIVAATLQALEMISIRLGAAPLAKQRLFRLGLEAIRCVQGGGSGADLAASLYRGWVYLTPEGSIERLEQLKHPMAWLYMGYKTSTKTMIARKKLLATGSLAGTGSLQTTPEHIPVIRSTGEVAKTREGTIQDALHKGRLSITAPEGGIFAQVSVGEDSIEDALHLRDQQPTEISTRVEAEEVSSVSSNPVKHLAQGSTLNFSEGLKLMSVATTAGLSALREYAINTSTHTGLSGSEATLKALTQWHRALALGQSALEAMGCVDSNMQRCIELARQHGLSVKVSGSGCGDCMLLYSTEPASWTPQMIPTQSDRRALHAEEVFVDQLLSFEKELKMLAEGLDAQCDRFELAHHACGSNALLSDEALTDEVISNKATQGTFKRANASLEERAASSTSENALSIESTLHEHCMTPPRLLRGVSWM